eukprot:jgi/Bigna1/137162/aug1.37_g11870
MGQVEKAHNALRADLKIETENRKAGDKKNKLYARSIVDRAREDLKESTGKLLAKETGKLQRAIQATAQKMVVKSAHESVQSALKTVLEKQRKMSSQVEQLTRQNTDLSKRLSAFNDLCESQSSTIKSQAREIAGLQRHKNQERREALKLAEQLKKERKQVSDSLEAIRKLRGELKQNGRNMAEIQKQSERKWAEWKDIWSQNAKQQQVLYLASSKE